jgi:hypothetical protein
MELVDLGTAAPHAQFWSSASENRPTMYSAGPECSECLPGRR